MPRTFVVDENIEAVPLNNSKRSYKSLLDQLPPFEPKVLLKATIPDTDFIPSQPMGNGFVSAAFLAYAHHHHLIISPDDIWIAITTAFSRYVNNQAEEMRNVFVSHQGRKELVITDVGTIHAVNWDSLIAKMSVQIDKNTNNDIKNWIIPDFSTTTTTTRTVGSVVLMAAMEKYFAYNFTLFCGLPKVTMLGTLEDWKKIRTKADALLSYNQEKLTCWHKVLTPILDEFISSFEGNVNSDFWNRIANKIGGGSGPQYLTGWILAFIPWNDYNMYQLRPIEHIKETNEYGKVDTNDIPASAGSVPVTINANGTEYKTTFYAGHLAAIPGLEQNSVQPYLGWYMFHNN